MKNPYDFFSSDYYTTTQIDTMVYNITVSGVTQQQLDDATVTFRTDSEIDILYTNATSTYLTLDEINTAGSAYTDGFIDSDAINTKIAGFMTEFLIPSEIDVIFSGYTIEFLNESEAQTQVDSGVTTSMDYWHPEPFYERTFFTTNYDELAPVTNRQIFILANPAGSQVTIEISGNTPWNITPTNVSWLETYVSTGTGTTSILVEANSQNIDSDRRDYTFTFGATDTVNIPWYVTIRQLGTGGSS